MALFKIKKDKRFTKIGKIVTTIGLLLFFLGLVSIWMNDFILPDSVIFVGMIIGFFACAFGLALWSGEFIYYW